MKIQTYLSCLALVGVLAIPAAYAQKPAHGDPKLLTEAKITPDAARAIALKARAGTVKEWEIEREAGGSGLRYSFDITASGKVFEVGVDARDGKVLENGAESAAKEKAETKAEKGGKDGEEDDDN